MLRHSNPSLKEGGKGARGAEENRTVLGGRVIGDRCFQSWSISNWVGFPRMPMAILLKGGQPHESSQKKSRPMVLM